MTGVRRPRLRLTRAEAALWAEVAASVRPLPGRPPMAMAAPLPLPDPPAASAAVAVAAPPGATPPPRRPPPLAPLETRLARKLARGREAVDARLDLHGLRQAEAHRRLIAFLAAAQSRGDRVALVITGKGAPDAGAAPFDARGVLRRLVPIWLEDPALRPLVIGFSPASPGHGGAGALYVRLRRAGRR
jgi:DNA-nicking Smr family endonuclease